MKSRVKIKLSILVLIVFIYKAVGQILSTIVANNLAMNQMYNALDSSVGIQIYSYAVNHAKVALAIFIIVLFNREVREIIKKLKEKMNEKKN